MRIRMRCLSSSPLIVFLSMFVFFNQSVAKTTTTTTALAITSDGTHVTTVPAGSVVKLTATVKAKGEVVTVGQINFCDTAAEVCTDIHLLGTAQLTSAGIAVMSFVPGIGKHSYKAVFAGTPNGALAYAGSASSGKMLSVTGKFATTTAISASGREGRLLADSNHNWVRQLVERGCADRESIVPRYYRQQPLVRSLVQFPLPSRSEILTEMVRQTWLPGTRAATRQPFSWVTEMEPLPHH